MAGNKPYNDPKKFASALRRFKSWQRMAEHFTQQGYPISEASIRRLAKKFDITLIDAHKDDVKVDPGLSKAEALDKKAKKALSEAKALAAKAKRDAVEFQKAATKELKEYKDALDKQFKQRLKEEIREATPAELAEYEQKLLRASQTATKYKKIAAQLARETNIIDEVSKVLQPVVEKAALPAVKRPDKLAGKSDDPFSLLLSLNDIHWGEIIDPRKINGLNAYSPNIAARRIEHVVDTVRLWAHNYRQVGEVDELVVLLNGDNFSGMHAIHPDESVEYARIGKQAMDSALVISQAIWELSHDFPKVRIIAPAGDNHTRSTRRNATSAVAVETSWSSMHHEMIASLLSRLSHVSMHIASSYQTFFDIKGFTWAAAHGHSLKGGGGGLGIPAYALKRLYDSTVSKGVIMAKNTDLDSFETVEEATSVISGIVQHLIIGHFHQMFYAQFSGGDVRIAPSLKGPDSFSNDILAKYSPSAQSLIAIHPKHDIVADHVINVQHIVDEGKTRYSWGALEGELTTAEIMSNWIG